MHDQQTLLKRLIHNIDLLLLLLCPAASAVGLVYTEGPWLLYSGIIGFAVALVMNHRKHQRARRPS